MTVLVAGAHGTTGQLVVQKLDAEGYVVQAMIRKEDQADEMEDLGAEPVVADLTEEVDHAVADCDAVIFAAGSKGKNLEEVDQNGAIKLIDAALDHGIEHFVMLSARGADDPASGPEKLRPYLEAKQAADEHLAASGLPYTIVRPGRLTDDDEQGAVRVARSLDADGSIPRADVAAVLVASLQVEAVRNETFELLSGPTPVREALEAL